MFAVKGWAVDASALKPQTEPFKRSDAASDGHTDSKKRKRDPAALKSEDVERLWDQHIEGKAPAQSKSQKKKDRKRQKTELTSNGAVQPEKDDVGQQSAKSSDDGENSGDVISKKDKKDEKDKTAKKDKKEKKNKASLKEQSADRAKSIVVPPKPLLPAVKLTPMQAAMRQKLISARFRHLNETLYTEPSAKSLSLFEQNPEMFEDYHSGFRQQVSVWPENPVDSFIATIRSRGGVRLQSQKKAFRQKNKSKPVEAPPSEIDRSIPPLPRTQGTCIIADMGCGDARLAHTFKTSEEGQKLQLKVLSYDLYSPSPLVTKADISNVPAADGSVDVAIFCLALMGTNWISFIEEAYRILHWKGELWIAEIKSRFGRIGKAGKVVEHSVGGKRKQAALKKAQEAKKREQEDVNEQEALQVEVDGVPTKNEETDVSAFVDVLKRRGFLLKNGDSSIDLNNKMFVRMEFVKAAAPTKGKGVTEQSKQAQTKFKSKSKFLDENAEEVATDDEAKTLKPCLYKIR